MVVFAAYTQNKWLSTSGVDTNLIFWFVGSIFAHSSSNFQRRSWLFKGCLLTKSPILKPILSRKVTSKIDQKFAFLAKMGSKCKKNVFKTTKRHTLTRNDVFWRIDHQNRRSGLGDSELEEPPPNLTSLPKVIGEKGRVAALSHMYAVKSPLVTMARPKFAPKSTPSRGPIPKPHCLPHPWTRPTYDTKRHPGPIRRFSTMHWTVRRTDAPTDRCTYAQTDRSSKGKFDRYMLLRYESDAA